MSCILLLKPGTADQLMTWLTRTLCNIKPGQRGLLLRYGNRLCREGCITALMQIPEGINLIRFGTGVMPGKGGGFAILVSSHK